MYRNKVRLIGGQWKRRQIDFPDQEGLRPTPDRVRETLFNWLGQDLHGRKCLDLFAGSGALGFEAASRYAARVVMVELARPVARALQENALRLQADGVEVVQSDSLYYAARCQEEFDVVFIDPPFASDLAAKVMPLLDRLASKSGVAYIECAQVPVFPVGWTVLRQSRAGKVNYFLLQRIGIE